MTARGQELAVELDANGSSWALAADLLSLYEIPYEWDATRRRILIGSLDVVPSFRADQVQPSVGWPLFEMTLQHGNAPVILRGILRDNRAWCRVLEFAEEFGNSLREKPAATAPASSPSPCRSGGVGEPQHRPFQLPHQLQALLDARGPAPFAGLLRFCTGCTESGWG
jgi:hypothetical protein